MPPRQLPHLLLGVALLLSGTGCSDTLVSPDTVRAQSASSSDRDLLLAILERLDDMESRVEREATMVRAALEAITGVEDLRVAFAPDSSKGNGNSDNAGLAGELSALTSLTDSLFVLAGWMATEMAAPWSGLESCFAVKVKGNADLKTKTMGDATGDAGVGVKPWDTGAAAKVALTQRFAMEFGVGAELEVGALGGCINYGNLQASPPVRAGPAPAGLRMAVPSGLEAALRNIPAQLSLDEARLQQMLQAGTGLLQSGDLTQIQGLASILPLPTITGAPLAMIQSRLSSMNPVSLLCTGTNFGNNLSGYVAQGCNYIQGGNLPDLGTYLNLGSNFAGLQNSFGSLCGRFNNVVDRRLVVNANLPWGGTNTLDVALFPAGWNVTC